jgi:SlyX protein
MQHIEADIEQLQMKVAFQEDTIEELNKALIKQQRQLDLLEFQLSHVINKVKEIEVPSGDSPQVEPPPPHY